MKELNQAEEWLKRAKSCLTRSKIGSAEPYVMREDLCYDAEQAVEKALKAFCISKGVKFPKTHDIGYLLDLLTNEKIKYPSEFDEARILTDYAVETRYPGDYDPVTESEYKKARDIAEKVYLWVETQII
jgi:HEPN domain-containing protein